MNTHLDEFRKLGCEDAVKCATASRAYMLTMKSIKNDPYVSLEKHYNAKIGCLYFKRKVTNAGHEFTKTILPILEMQQIDFNEVECLQNDNPKNRITVAISDSFSNIVHHTIAKDFVDKEVNCIS